MHKTFWPATLLALVVSIWGHGQQQIDAKVRGLLGPESPIGLVVGTYKDGRTSYHTYGHRDTHGTQPMDSLTLFEIGSATKTFTGLLLAKKIANQTFAIDALMDPYLPDSIGLPPTVRERVRLTDLVSHQSGLPNLSNDHWFNELLEKDPRNPFRYVDNDYLYRILASVDSLSGHGRYQYNNYAFALLGSILERQSGTPFRQLMELEILRPLGLGHTTFDVPDQPNVAGLYDQKGTDRDPIALNKVDPAGGLRSNAVDLIKYLRAHLDPTVLGRAIPMTQRVFLEDGPKKIGLAWEIHGDYYQKDGDTFGNSCLLRYSPKNNVAVVVLSNHQHGHLVRDVMEVVYSTMLEKEMDHDNGY